MIKKLKNQLTPPHPTPLTSSKIQLESPPSADDHHKVVEASTQHSLPHSLLKPHNTAAKILPQGEYAREQIAI